MLDWLSQPPDTDLPAPELSELKAALRMARPDLAAAAIEALDEGWAFRAFRAGDCVLRFLKREVYTRTLAAEAGLLPVLAPELPLPISVIELHEDGPNGLPYTSHRFVPGVKAEHVAPLAANAGETLGRFLRALHDFPTQRAVDYGIAVKDVASWRQDRADLYAAATNKCFPLVSTGARSHIERTFETYLCDEANFAFRPALVHNDIDERNVMADPETGELTGVIDWGDMRLGDPAIDLVGPLIGDLAKGGLKGQMKDLERGYGESLEPLIARCRFFMFCWPVYHVLHGLNTHDQKLVADGVRKINARVPSELRCD